MAGNNYFDQFDGTQPQAPQKNYFDQFDAQQGQPQAQNQANMAGDSAPVTLSGVGKSLASGLYEGVRPLAWLSGYLDPTNYFNQGGPIDYGKYYDATVKSTFGGLHKPQNAAERYANVIGQFAPAAIGGPEGLVPKIVDTVIPAITSESVGHALEGTPYETAGRFVGALGAPTSIATAGRVLAKNSPEFVQRYLGVAPTAVKPAALTADELFNQSSEGFDRALAGGKGATIPKEQGQQFLDTATSEMAGEGFDPSLDTNSARAVNFVQGKIDNGTLTLGDLHRARQLANKGVVAGSNDAHFAGLFNDHVDNFMSQNVEGGPELQNAIALNRAARKTKIIEDQISSAQLDANAGKGDFATNLQNRFLSLARPTNKLLRNFNDDEKDAIRAVSQGGLIHGAANWIGQKVASFPGKATAAVGGAVGGFFSPAGPFLGPLIGGVEGWKGAEKLGGALKRWGLGSEGRAEAAQALVSGGANPVAQAQYQAAKKAALANAVRRYAPPLIAGATQIPEAQ